MILALHQLLSALPYVIAHLFSFLSFAHENLALQAFGSLVGVRSVTQANQKIESRYHSMGWWYLSKKCMYSRCRFVDLTRGLNRLSSRISTILPSPDRCRIVTLSSSRLHTSLGWIAFPKFPFAPKPPHTVHYIK